MCKLKLNKQASKCKGFLKHLNKSAQLGIKEIKSVGMGKGFPSPKGSPDIPQTLNKGGKLKTSKERFHDSCVRCGRKGSPEFGNFSQSYIVSFVLVG